MQEQTIGKKRYIIDESLEKMAKVVELTNSEIDLADANIKYMKVYPNISKTVAGRCMRASKELKFFSGCDYVIQMSGELWDTLSEDTRKVLMLHELMHVYVEMDAEGDPVYKLRQHDVEDFASILEEHGVHWILDIRDKAVAADPKLDPKSMKL